MLMSFIEQKSKQLVFYVTRFLRGQLPHRELHLFVWDTLEEWGQFKIQNKDPSDPQERVFWHLLHQLEFWSESQLRYDRKVRRHLHHAIACLQGKRQVRLEFVGVRP